MKYSIFCHLIYGEIEQVSSFGILVKDKNDREVKRIYDVSQDYNAILNFVSRLNEIRADLPVFYDLLEDYYTEHY